MNQSLLERVAREVIDGINTHRTEKGLRTKTFFDGGRKILAIEQNPRTNSRWARLAKEGAKVVQFKDAGTKEWIGVSVDGDFKEY